VSTTAQAAIKATLRRAPALRLSLILAGVTIALAVIDVFLEKTEQGEVAAQALGAYRAGTALLQEGKANDAVDAFRRAHALERERPLYEIGLIEALMAAGKLAEAQPLMSDILDQESNNGEANLIAARLAAKQGHINLANAYYHRAIYGEWRDGAAEHQSQVRLELIHFLEAHGKQDEMLAELLPLQEEASKNPTLQPTVASLFLAAGAPAHAQEIYRRLIKANPKNGSNYASLGEAELALGDYRAARNAFSTAIERDDNGAVEARLQLAITLSNLDPTPRRLSTPDKYARSMRILGLASGDLQQCVTNHPERATDKASQFVTAAQTELAQRAPKTPTNEMAEDVLSLAENIWRTRTSVCGTGTAPDEDALKLIMEKLAK
jgi:tetratricopeptide (TPR) repeat protein